MRTKETEDEKELAIAIINEFNSIDFDKIINIIKEYNNKHNCGILLNIIKSLTKLSDKSKVIKNYIDQATTYRLRLRLFKVMREFCYKSGRKYLILNEKLTCSIMDTKDYNNDNLDENNVTWFCKHRVVKELVNIGSRLKEGKLREDINNYVQCDDDESGYYSMYNCDPDLDI